MADGESTTEQWRTQLQNDLQNIFESFMSRWDKRLDEMFGRKDNDIAGKPEQAKMSSTGSEVQTNDFNQVVKEIVTVVDVENGAQVLMDTKTIVVEEPLQVKKPAKLEEDGCQQVWLGDKNSDSVERRAVIDQIHSHEISSKISNVIDDYEKFDGIYSMMFVDKNIVVDDPYGFRLLVMGKGNGLIPFGYDWNGGKTGFEIYFSMVSGNAYMFSIEIVGHTSTIYFVDSHVFELILCGSKDRFAKRLKNGICVQSLQHPGCVWDAKILGNRDIVTTYSDCDIRIWTIDQGNIVDPSKFEAYASELYQYKLSGKSVDGLKLEDLLGLETLQTLGFIDCQTNMVREWDNGAYKEDLILICIMRGSKIRIVEACEVFVEFVDSSGYTMMVVCLLKTRPLVETGEKLIEGHKEAAKGSSLVVMPNAWMEYLMGTGHEPEHKHEVQSPARCLKGNEQYLSHWVASQLEWKQAFQIYCDYVLGHVFYHSFAAWLNGYTTTTALEEPVNKLHYSAVEISKLTGVAGGIDQSLTLVVKMSLLLSILNLYGIASGKGNHVDLSHCNNPSHVLDFIGAFELGNCWKGLNVMVVLIEVMKFKNAYIAAKEKLSDDNQPTSTLSVNGKVTFQKTQLGRLPKLPDMQQSIMVFILEDKDVFKGTVFDMSQLVKSVDN